MIIQLNDHSVDSFEISMSSRFGSLGGPLPV